MRLNQETNRLPSFSIIIPTFNRAELLRKCLASVRTQTYRHYEVIVVDDGSTDHTAEVLAEYADDIRVIRQPNGGPGAARNLGAAQAAGEYLAFLDSDDLWFPWTLKNIAALIEQHQPSIVSGALLPFENESELTDISSGDLTADVYTDYLASYEAGCFVGAGMAFIKRDTFLSSGGFTTDIVNCEDHDLMLRLGTQPGFVNILSPPTISWRRHSGSTTKNFRLSFEGVRYLLQSEQQGYYPGGSERSTARRSIICSHVRPASLECLQGRLTPEAWQLYKATLGWHVLHRRLKYLLGFPVRFLQKRLTGQSSMQNSLSETGH